MRRVSAAVAGIFASVFWWGTAGAIDTNIGPQFRGWDGFYIGVNAGYIHANTRWSDPFGFTSGDFSGASNALGITVGKNWQNGRWVYGVEGDWSFSELQAATYGAISCFPLNCQTDLNAIATLRGRVGYLLNPNLLLFGTAGLAAAKFTHGNILFSSAKNTGIGYALGGGIEAKVAPQWTVKAEYIFASIDGGKACDIAFCFVGVESDKFHAHIFRLGVNRHFGQSGTPQIPVAPANRWTGFYAGVVFGHAQSFTEWSDPFFGLMSGEFDGKNAFGGLNAGFNWQSGRWIYGFEGDAVFTSIRSSNANSVCFCFPAETEITHILSFRGRVGYLVMPNTLVFVSGGIAAANMKFGIVGLQTGSAVEAGPAVGAGIEVQVLGNWTLKGEYLFMSFGSSEACNTVVCAGPLYSDYVDVHMARLAINRYF